MRISIFKWYAHKHLLLYNLFTKWRILPLQNDIQNNGSEFNSIVHKMPHVQKGMICIYAATFSMTLRFLILPSFLFTRNLRIDKNYTLSIFMLSGSIQFYSNFQFNMTCIYHKIMSVISNYTHAYSLHMLSLYKSLIISKYAFSHAFNLLKSNHEIQTYTPKDVFSLQIPFTLINVCYFTLTIQFTFMTDSIR